MSRRTLKEKKISRGRSFLQIMWLLEKKERRKKKKSASFWNVSLCLPHFHSKSRWEKYWQVQIMKRGVGICSSICRALSWFADPWQVNDHSNLSSTNFDSMNNSFVSSFSLESLNGRIILAGYFAALKVGHPWLPFGVACRSNLARLLHLSHLLL